VSGKRVRWPWLEELMATASHHRAGRPSSSGRRRAAVARVARFFSAARPGRKSIVMALATGPGMGRVVLERLERLDHTWMHFRCALDRAQVTGWVASTCRFGLPRELVETLGWPTDWFACMRHYALSPSTRCASCFAGVLRGATRRRAKFGAPCHRSGLRRLQSHR